MGRGYPVILNVNNTPKKSTEIDYDDLVWLYKDFININHHVPIGAECLSKNNLPQMRIINRILKENNILYNDFINQFGKYKHVRSNIDNYNIYLEKFIELSKNMNHTPTIEDLKNNKLGLPSASWFVKYCPDKNVQTYKAFIEWCNLPNHDIKKNKQSIVDKLYELEQKLGRPIKRSDISEDKVGFSMMVINRIWGGLNNCKEELRLLPQVTAHYQEFDYYKFLLDNILDDFSCSNDKRIITWKDIENNQISNIDHKTLKSAFDREQIDLFSYIKSRGFSMNPSNFSHRYIFDDGEKVLSSMEYDVSSYLKSQGLVYKSDYKRDVMYKNFLLYDKSSKMNCDYVIFNNYYLEVLGMITNSFNDWETHIYPSLIEQEYQKKMLMKKELLENNNLNYLFLFSEDFINDAYITKINHFIFERRCSNA